MRFVNGSIEWIENASINHLADLSNAALREEPYAQHELVLFGGDAFEPGANFDALLKAVSTGAFLGYVGWCFDEAVLVSVDVKVRAAVAQLLQLGAAECSVLDPLSVEWAAHYGLHGTVGGHPAWLADAATARNVFPPVEEPDFEHKGRVLHGTGCIRVSSCFSALPELVQLTLQDLCQRMTLEWIAGANVEADVAEIDAPVLFRWPECALVFSISDLIAAYVAGLTPVIYVNTSWGFKPVGKREFLPLVRYATQLGLQDRLCYTLEQVSTQLREVFSSAGEQCQADADVVERERDLARETIDALLRGRSSPGAGAGPAAVVADLLGEPAPAQEPPSRVLPRELRLGAVFDPTRHYTLEYFGEGAGLLYTAPNGTKQLYKGPARDWDGYEAVVDCLLAAYGSTLKSARILDVGCGGGHFVRRMRARGINAGGIDLSREAINMAPPDVQPALICGDVTRLPPDLARARFELITTWDFWEHIWSKDLRELAGAVYDMLMPGGIMCNIICTRGKYEQDYAFEPGVVFSPENSFLLCAGHVTIHTWAWWRDFFVKCGFRENNDFAYRFQVARAEDPSLSQCPSWGPRNLLVVQR